MDPAGRWAAFYRVVRRVPRGRVTTYGDVALLAGCPGAARLVGHALAALRGTRHHVPWQRVVGKRSRTSAGISILDPMGAAVQRALLEREGVVVDERGRVSLAEFGWSPVRAAGGVARAGRRAPRAAGAGGVTRRPAPASPSRSARRTRGSSGRS